jgi:hypothetical protein
MYKRKEFLGSNGLHKKIGIFQKFANKRLAFWLSLFQNNYALIIFKFSMCNGKIKN